MTAHAHPPADLNEPPPPTSRVLMVGLVGVGLVVVALVYGLATAAPRQGFEPHSADGPRALIAIVGLFVTGCAVSMRPRWFGGWLCAAAAAILGYGFGMPAPAGTEWYLSPPRDWFAGVPNAWDSIQLFFGVAAVIGLIGTAWTFLPRRAVLGLILAGAAFHFAGILSAMTSPAPTPFLSDQYWRRIARPYLQFAYMNNAYQFYSPDPGPACEIWAAIEYKPEGVEDNDPDAPKHCAWVTVPTRRDHWKDPLGLSYYRRLSLTENSAQIYRQGYFLPPAEAELVRQRRESEIHRIPRYGQDAVQRVVPIDLVSRQVLPAYARRIAYANPKDGWKVTGVKVYRVQHAIVNPEQFVGYDQVTNKRWTAWSPYNASLYMPYFQGDFKRDGTLKDSEAPLLYWMVPIEPIETPPLSRKEYRATGGFRRYFKDNVAEHGGCPRPMVTIIEEPPEAQLKAMEFKVEPKKGPDGERP